MKQCQRYAREKHIEIYNKYHLEVYVRETAWVREIFLEIIKGKNGIKIRKSGMAWKK
jgi:hypothetical protein